MDNIPPHIQQIINDRSLSMNQKMVAFMMIMDPKVLPDNPNKPDFTDLGKDIKKLVDDNKISIKGFDKNFKIRIICD